jgi:nucleoside-diphosphate-sugar epimerase
MGIGEDNDKTPTTHYDQSKWDGEQKTTAVCAERNLPLAVLRPTLIYGPGSRYGLATWLSILTLRHHLGLRSVPMAPGGPMGHHVHVEDVARAGLLLATHDDATGGVFNICDDVPMSAGDLVRMLADTVGIRIIDGGLPWWTTRFVFLIRPLGAWLLKRENPKLAHLWSKFTQELELSDSLTPRIDIEWLDYVLDDHGFDNSSLKGLGFELRHPDITVGLQTAIDWYREQRWLPPAPPRALLTEGAATDEQQADDAPKPDSSPVGERSAEPPTDSPKPASAPPA